MAYTPATGILGEILTPPPSSPLIYTTPYYLVRDFCTTAVPQLLILVKFCCMG